MTTWKIENINKRSLIETREFAKDDKHFVIEIVWRFGSLTCESDVKPDVDLKNDSKWFPLSSDDNWEIEEYSWGDVTFSYDNMTDEEQAEIELMYEEDGAIALEDNGWIETDSDVYFVGPMMLTNVDTGETFSGEL